jgi:hypothetical protein
MGILLLIAYEALASRAAGSRADGARAHTRDVDPVARAVMMDKRKRAQELGISGVAVVAYFQGTPIDSCASGWP